jgi:hypothetical protein
MRLAFSFFFNAVRGATVVSAEAKECALSHFELAPMVVLANDELRRVTGGDDEQLPKGGWKAVAASTD